MKYISFLILLILFFFKIAFADANITIVCNINSYDNYKKAINSYEKTLQKDPLDIYSNYCLARTYITINKPHEAIGFLRKLRQLVTKRKFDGKVYRLLGLSYLTIFLNNKSLFYKDNEITFTTPKTYTKNIYMLMNNLAGLRRIHKTFTLSTNYFKEALRLVNRNNRCIIYNDLAFAYFLNNNIKKAISYEKRATLNAKTHKNYKELPYYLFNIGFFQYEKSAYYMSNRFFTIKQSLNYFKKAKIYFLEHDKQHQSLQISYFINRVLKSFPN